MLFRSLLAAIPALLLCESAVAVGYYCDGKVTQVGLNNGDGRLWVSYGSIGWQQICAIGGAVNGVQADSCRGWLSLLLSAQAQDRTVRFYYYSDTPGNPASCAGFQSWGTYSPYFVHTVD